VSHGQPPARLRLEHGVDKVGNIVESGFALSRGMVVVGRKVTSGIAGS
jgi:hypothetical protein